MAESCAPVRDWTKLLAPALLLLASACERAPLHAVATHDAPRDTVTGMLQGSTAGFAVADRVRAFSFPADHAPHPAFRTEWWYFTGHLRGADGAQYGFQYTVFRQALTPPAVQPIQGPSAAGSLANPTSSAWRADTVWLAHLALTDLARARHDARARIARGALGLGGASAQPDGALRIVVDGWTLQRNADASFAIAADTNDGPALALRLLPRAAVVAQGDDGLSRKGPTSASYYYSIPRWQVSGRVRNASASAKWVDVQGDAWLDREWSTSALAPEQTGWDWFSLNLADGRDLMLFRLRRRDGARDPFDAGTLSAEGRVLRLRREDFDATPLRTWTDEQGRQWPVAWRVRLRKPALEFEVRAQLDDQLMRVGFEYWEGAVVVSGGAQGQGYLEMTGYGRAK